MVRRKRGQAPSPETVLAGKPLSRRRSQSPFSTPDLALWKQRRWAMPTLRATQTARLTAFLVLWDGTVMPILSIRGEVGVKNPDQGKRRWCLPGANQDVRRLGGRAARSCCGPLAVAGRRGCPRRRVAPDVRVHQRQPSTSTTASKSGPTTARRRPRWPRTGSTPATSASAGNRTT